MFFNGQFVIILLNNYKEIEKCIKEYNKQMARDNNSMAIGLYESASSADAATAESSNVSDTGGYSDTNVRENGVGEADIVKTDGKTFIHCVGVL